MTVSLVISTAFVFVIMRTPRRFSSSMYVHRVVRPISASVAVVIHPALRNGNFVEDSSDDFLGRDRLSFGLVREDDPVAEHVVGDGLDVFGGDVATAAHEGVSFARLRQVESGAWGAAE